MADSSPPAPGASLDEIASRLAKRKVGPVLSDLLGYLSTLTLEPAENHVCNRVRQVCILYKEWHKKETFSELAKSDPAHYQFALDAIEKAVTAYGAKLP